MDADPPGMNRPYLAALAVLALVIACLAVLLSGPAVQAAEEGGPTEVENEVGREAIDDTQDEDVSQAGRSEIDVETVPSGSGSNEPTGELPERFLRGTVLDEKYEPIAEAWVLTDRETEPVQTDEEGNFEIALLEDFGPGDGRSLCAWKEGLSITRKYVRQLEENLLILKPDEGKEMRIVDADSGLPIEGAEVELLVEADTDHSAGFFDLRNFAPLPMEVQVSDADGKVKIPDPKVSNQFTLEVRKEGYVKRYVDHWNLQRRDEIRLSTPEELRMRFVRKDGTPHAGAQLCFPWYRKIVTLDEEGWGDLPPEARWGFWSVQLRDESTQWVWSEVEDSRIQTGAELATDWRPRKGRLYVQGDEKPDVFEVGTSAAWENWGWEEFLPHPQWNQEAVEWMQVGEDGFFDLPSGWQGDVTYLHVRRVGSEGVLLSQKLVGDGPYELTLSAAAQVEIEVRCPRPELLEGASLSFYGWETDHEQTVELLAGKTSLRLPADTYSTNLILANAAHNLPLDPLVVIGLDLEKVYHFDGVRTVGGRLTAGGEPVFPCRVDLRTDRGFSMRTETRPDGSWAVEGVPKEEIRLSLRPENQWLVPVEGSYLWMPATLDRFDHDLEVATLLLSLGSFPPDRLEGMRASRRARPSAPRYSPINGKRQRHSSASPTLPDLSQGPVEIMVTPGRIRFSSERTGVPLADLEIELSAGDVRTFMVDTIPTTIARVVVGGFQQPLWGSVSWQPVHVPGLDDFPGFEQQDARSSQHAGQIGNSIHLLPGRWRMIVRAPFWSQEVRGQIGQGTVDQEIQVSGSSHTVRIQMDRQDRISLAQDDS